MARMGNWSGVINLLCEAINSLSNAGADFALMAANTPHKVFNEVAARSPLPLLSIVEETGKIARKSGFAKVGLFASTFTVQSGFYSDVLSIRYGVSVVTPGKADQDFINNKIATELVSGQVFEQTRQGLSKIADMMVNTEYIEALILGCTELPLILTQESLRIPVLDTTRIHAEAAFDFSQMSCSSI